MGTEMIYLVFYNIFGVTLASCLYSIGGTAGFSKLFRRVGCSLIIGIALNSTAIVLKNWHWQYAAVTIVLFWCYSEGYGGNSTQEKFKKRMLVAGTYAISYFLGLWACGFSGYAWVVFSMSCVMALMSALVGVINPWYNARFEEAFIGAITSMLLISWPFVR